MSSEERLMQVLLGPHVSEKATASPKRGNQVVFKVRTDATKTEIRRRRAVVRGQGRARCGRAAPPGKTKRFGNRDGTRAGLEEGLRAARAGPDINFMGAE